MDHGWTRTAANSPPDAARARPHARARMPSWSVARRTEGLCTYNLPLSLSPTKRPTAQPATTTAALASSVLTYLAYRVRRCRLLRFLLECFLPSVAVPRSHRTSPDSPQDRVAAATTKFSADCRARAAFIRPIARGISPPDASPSLAHAPCRRFRRRRPPR